MDAATSALLTSTDWGGLSHAYGSAADAPGQLIALPGGTPAETTAAVNYLFGAINHQGSLYPATAPAARVVARLLPECSGAVENAFPERPTQPLRAALLDFLAGIGESIVRWSPVPVSAGELDEEERMLVRALTDCQQAAPELLDAAGICLSDPHPRVRASAANAVAWLARAPGCQGAIPSVLHQLTSLIATQTVDTVERAALAISIGHLGGNPRDLLDDPHPAVRTCAALADDARATTAILDALREPATADGWLPGGVPQLEGRLRFALVRAAIGRVPTFERLLPAALAIAQVAHKYTVGSDWGPLLRAAFPQPPGRGPLTDSQCRYLRALTDNSDLWDPRFGNAHIVFRDVGLPYDRDACRRLAG